jgi:hypothetical protein
MQELLSLLGELKTLEAIAKASGVVPPNVTEAIDKVLAVLSDTNFVKPDSTLAVISDVSMLISDIDKLEADPAVKEFAKQVLTLIENIRNAVKPAYAPASVVIRDVPAAS